MVLVPLAVASLATGVLEALTSRWGLLEHYSVVVVKLGATVVLVAYTQTLSSFADVAASAPLSASDLAGLRSPSVVLHATGASVLLALALVLAVYKPRGPTRHGQRHAPPRSGIDSPDG